MFRKSHLGLSLAVCAAFALQTFPLFADAPEKATVNNLYNAPTLVAQNEQDAQKPGTEAKAKKEEKTAIDTGRTAWMLVSCALVLLMIPGLALFYGGMVRSKNILNTVMLSMACMAVIGVEWVLIGNNMAFGDSIGGIFGWSEGGFALGNIAWDSVDKTGVPSLVGVAFQGMFAIITPALISGAIAERVKFSSFLVFSLLWAIVVYNPLAHMVWGSGGLLYEDGVLDFAGGTVVHISAGFSALVLAIAFLGKRVGYPEDTISPSSLVLTLLGAGLLWFGWFGFNAGSAIAVNDVMATAALAFMTTQAAAATAALTWILAEWIFFGKPTAVGFASGVVAGLVAITPAAGHVSVGGALILGLLAGIVCLLAVSLKGKLGYDDSLDCFGVHGIGGLLGALLVGILATVNGEGSGAQFGKQVYGALVGIGLAVVGTLVIGFIVDKTMGFRVNKRTETLGLDQTQHGEQGYRLH